MNALPALSKTGSLIAFCAGNKLSVEDYPAKERVAEFKLDIEPVFISWLNENMLLLFCFDRFRVLEFDLKSGTTGSSDLKYITNYNQEAGASEISRIIKTASPDLEEILDSY